MRFSHIRCVSTCQVFTGLVDVSHFSLLPFPPLFLAASHFSLPSPVVKGHAGKMKPNRGEKWNIDFLFFFFCLHSTPDSFFRSVHFHASSSLFFYPPCLDLSAITLHNSLTSRCTLPLWGLRRSLRRNRESEFICFVCFSESCSDWPVPDDQEPRRFSQRPWCTGDWVQKWFVLVKRVTCWFLSTSLIYLNFPFEA